MEIKVLGLGCSKCHATIGIIERAAKASGVNVEITKVDDPEEIKRSGVCATPAVVIDGTVVHSGGLASHKEVQAGLKRRRQDHRDPGGAAGQGRGRCGGAHLRRTARAGLEQPAARDQRRVPRQRAQ